MTTVKIPDELEKEIESLKVHPKQPAYEIIQKGISFLKALEQARPQLIVALKKDRSLTQEQRRTLEELFSKI